MGQLIQLVGAILVLAGYVGAQLRVLHPRSFLYLIVNLLGSAVLAVLAFQERQWGFLLATCSDAVSLPRSVHRRPG
jgi:hypothetical protein